MHAHRPADLAVAVSTVDHVLGPEHAPVTIVEYGDFECPNCKLAAPTVKLLLERFTNQVRFAFRHFPLEQPHPHALGAAQAAECAGAQGRFWEMHDLLFEHQQRLTRRDLDAYAGRLGLDMARFAAEMGDEVYLQRVREHMEGARRSHVRTTPGFFVNGVIQDVSFGLQGLLDSAAAALRRP
jgi:protein-disulfide isomerase